MNEGKILAAATAVKNELHNLLDAQQAEQMQIKLENLLTRMEKGENVRVEIIDLLGDYDTTENYFKAQLAKLGYIPDTETRSYTPLPGDHTPPKPLGSPSNPKPK